MGRAMLMVVLLVSCIYGGIVMNAQREMYKLPAVIVESILQKEVENVSDYAIRNAIRNACAMTVPTDTEALVEFTQVYTNYTIGHTTIDSIRFSFVNSADNFQVKTYVRGVMQGRTVTHSGEMAYNYPQESIGAKPDAVYMEMEKFALFPWLFAGNRFLPDTSGNNYTATVNNILISATVPYGGAYSRMCAQFDGIDNYITIGQDTTNFGVATEMDTDASFSFVCFAKIDKNGRSGYTNNQGTLMWLASDPWDGTTASGTHPGLNLRAKPSAGIWYSKADGKVHFMVTLDNGTASTVECAVAYTRYAQIYYWLFGIPIFNFSHYNYAWNSFGMTFASGTLKAYINGALVQTTASGLNFRARPSIYGMSMGRRDLRYAGVAYNDYKYFCGLLDQLGMYGHAITGNDMYQWHQGVLNAANILYIKD